MELTTEQLLQVFGVTPMTLYNWRKGIDKKKVSKLPYHTRKLGSRHRIYFVWGEVRQWALKNDVAVLFHPKELKKLFIA